MKRVSILGCGRLGLTLGRELAQAGFTVKGSTTRSERFDQLRDAGIEPVQLALTPAPEGDLAAILDTDVLVITLTPPMGPPGSIPPVSYIEQLSAVAKAAAEAGVKQVIFTGATFIYPLNNREVTEADVDPQKSSFMGIDWLEVEQAVCSTIPEHTTVLRLAGLMGEGHNSARYFSGRPMAGANDPVNMIHQDDVAGIIHKLIEKDVKGEVLNASAPQHPTRRDFYTLASEKAGIAPPQFTEEARPYRIINCDKLKQQLDYSFRHPDPLKAL